MEIEVFWHQLPGMTIMGDTVKFKFFEATWRARCMNDYSNKQCITCFPRSKDFDYNGGMSDPKELRETMKEMKRLY